MSNYSIIELNTIITPAHLSQQQLYHSDNSIEVTDTTG